MRRDTGWTDAPPASRRDDRHVRRDELRLLASRERLCVAAPDGVAVDGGEQEDRIGETFEPVAKAREQRVGVRVDCAPNGGELLELRIGARVRDNETCERR